jgi:hypothetical protein
MAGDGLSPGAVAAQQLGEGTSQRDYPGVLAIAGDMPQASEQAIAFGAHPGQRLPGVVQGRGRLQGAWYSGRRAGAGLTGQAFLGQGGSVLVIIQQPPQRLLPARVSDCMVAGIAAQQIMHAVPAVPALGQQPLPVQAIQQPPGPTSASAAAA